MKKSIKYAGIAAATLLAVAPVAAPVISATTTVQAADAATSIKKADADEWLNQFKDSYTLTATPIDDVLTNGTNYGTGLNVKPSDFFKDSFFGQMHHATLEDKTVNDKNAKITSVTATANDKKVAGTLDAAGANKILKDANGSGVTFTITMTFNNSATTTATTTKEITVLPVAKTTDTDAITSLAATYSKDYNVAYGSSTVNPTLTNTLDLTLNDSNNKNLANDTDNVTSVALGSYYTTYANALSASGSTFTDATFGDKDATYYQPITVNVKSGSDLQTFLGQMSAKGYSYTVNGVNASTTDNGQLIKDASGNITGIKMVRAINVTKDGANSDWTVKDVKGVLNTKSDKAFYTLHNDADQLVSNRALDKNSAWQTDKVRTNASGAKQYRVSTHEWIPAEDVTFEGSDVDTGSTTDPEGALTVTKLDKNKIVNISTTGMVYFLYNSKGVESTTRALGGGTAWQVDKTAKDAAGNVYYGVSTDEFVKAGEGVSLAN
ncbi:hypothetical protein [Companilactobacillus kedongensis]|uniref:hypothetical protein n=1 Tax=Companilactobacillus kedongensis TaxID=2486004 RepID=UPI000F77AEFF|nr:hypothetical protein [Companilactobacillus kedongensis]